MRVERFSLFFPPTIFKVSRGETEYAIGAIPLGGYVKITGMNPEEIKDLHPDIARRAYYTQAPWKRIAVILAGPGVNILIAFLLFWAILFSGSLSGARTLGKPQPLDHHGDRRLARSVRSSRERPLSAYCMSAIGSSRSRAAEHGRNSAMQRIGAHRCAGALTEGCRAATPVQLTIRRAGQTLKLSIFPRYNKAKGGCWWASASRGWPTLRRAQRRRDAMREMWGTDHDSSEHRQGLHERESASSVPQHHRRHRNRARNGRRRRRLRAGLSRLRLARARRAQPVPVSPARRRAHPLVGRGEGPWQAGYRSWRCGATARSGSSCCCSW